MDTNSEYITSVSDESSSDDEITVKPVFVRSFFMRFCFCAIGFVRFYFCAIFFVRFIFMRYMNLSGVSTSLMFPINVHIQCCGRTLITWSP